MEMEPLTSVSTPEQCNIDHTCIQLTSLEDIKSYFEQFSGVKEAMLAYDKVTNRHRGFGFVTFDNEDVVDKICEIHFHEINGKSIIVRLYTRTLRHRGLASSHLVTGHGVSRSRNEFLSHKFLIVCSSVFCFE